MKSWLVLALIVACVAVAVIESRVKPTTHASVESEASSETPDEHSAERKKRHAGGHHGHGHGKKGGEGHAHVESEEAVEETDAHSRRKRGGADILPEEFEAMKGRLKTSADCKDKWLTTDNVHSMCLDANPKAKESHVITDQAEIDLILKTHNDYRSTLAASDKADVMFKMEWDDRLAEAALGWASQCYWKHDKNDMRMDPERYQMGQNLAWSESVKYDWKWVVDFWLDEDQYFDWSIPGCSGGEMCGHYTAAVHGATRKVGCAYADCTHPEDASDPDDGHFWACDYGPAGNVGGFGNPYKRVATALEGCGTTNGGLCECPGAEECSSFEELNAKTCKCEWKKPGNVPKCKMAHEGIPADYYDLDEYNIVYPDACSIDDNSCCAAHDYSTGKEFLVSPSESCAWLDVVQDAGKKPCVHYKQCTGAGDDVFIDDVMTDRESCPTTSSNHLTGSLADLGWQVYKGWGKH